MHFHRVRHPADVCLVEIPTGRDLNFWRFWNPHRKSIICYFESENLSPFNLLFHIEMILLNNLIFFIIWSFSRTLHFCSSRIKCIVSLLSLDSRYCSLGMDSSCSPVSFLLTPVTLQLTCSYIYSSLGFGQMSSSRFSLDFICSFSI